MKVKLTTRRLIIISIVVAVFAAIIWYQMHRPPEYYTVLVGSKQVYFRADPREAASVPVYPNDEAVYNLIRDPLNYQINIAFKPTDAKNNSLYVIEGYEIGSKLKILFQTWKRPPNITGVPIDFYENLSGQKQSPIIAMVNPVYASDTSLRVQNRTIFISGTNLHNFDLATVKFFMIVFNITISQSNA